MKKILLVFSFLLCLLASITAQTPQQFKYQAVARDASGQPYVSTPLQLRFYVAQGNANGPAVYAEEHAVTTTSLGVFDLNIGAGIPIGGGSLANIDWSAGPYFLRVELNPNASGGAFIPMGASQLLSVPYALYAETSGSDRDEQTLSINGAQLSISGGNSVVLPAGPQGPTGPAGATGASGPMGPQGPTGLTGATGPQGLPGVAGPTGATGPMGLQGPAGPTGANGPQGLPGVAGPQGATGPMGPAGTYAAGAGISISNAVISAADNSPVNELQTHSLNGNVLSISGANGAGTHGASVTLPSSGGSNYLGGSGISIVPGFTGDFIINNAAPSKWTENGQNIHNTNGGTVTIGTTTPSGHSQLTVVGDHPNTGYGVTGSGTSTGVAGYGGAVGVAGGSENGAAVLGISNFGYGGFFSSPLGGHALITEQGNVGIGTNSPQYKLDVWGTARILDELTVNSDITSGNIFPAADNTADLGDPGFRWRSIHTGELRAVVTTAPQTAMIAMNTDPNGYAAEFFGDVAVVGNLAKSGGTFKIDHPLAPADKYLYHSFVESPDMMNIYNGNATTDAAGMATVELPAYFEALNMEFRYQLTCIGQFAQAIVKEKVAGNHFVIQTDKPGVEVSWQVTGIRQDAYAKAHRVVPEVEKKAEDKGKYLHPELFGAKPEERIGSHRATGAASKE